MNAKEMREEIKNVIESLDNDGLEKFWKFIIDNCEVVTTDSDKETIAMGEQDIKVGKFRGL